MAFGVKQWVGVVLAGCALVALRELPPRAPLRFGRAAPSAAEERAAALGTEVQRTQELLKRLRWQDSLPGLLAHSAVDGVAVGGPRIIPDALLAAIRTDVIKEREQLDQRSPEVLFGYYFQPRGQAAQPGVPTRPLFGNAPEILVGRIDGRPYCMAVDLVDPGIIVRSRRVGQSLRASDRLRIVDRLGMCRLVLQFGLPGPAVTAWLKGGAAVFAAAAVAPPAETSWRGGWEDASPAFRALWTSSVSQSTRFRRCLTGQAPACLGQALVAGAGAEVADEGPTESVTTYVTARSAFVQLSKPAHAAPFGFASPYLLSDLQHDFGPEAFGRFWRSDEDVLPAFRDAFGVDMGRWLVEWVEGNLPTYRAGPSLEVSTWVGSLFLLALCGAIAWGWASKRSVA